jgi:hypothetical protein
MLERFEIIPFLAGITVAYFIVFWVKPETAGDRVVKWPRPENCGKVTYRDRNGICYKFESQIVDCGKVADKLENYALE